MKFWLLVFNIPLVLGVQIKSYNRPPVGGCGPWRDSKTEPDFGGDGGNPSNAILAVYNFNDEENQALSCTQRLLLKTTSGDLYLQVAKINDGFKNEDEILIPIAICSKYCESTCQSGHSIPDDCQMNFQPIPNSNFITHLFIDEEIPETLQACKTSIWDNGGKFGMEADRTAESSWTPARIHVTSAPKRSLPQIHSLGCGVTFQFHKEGSRSPQAPPVDFGAIHGVDDDLSMDGRFTLKIHERYCRIVCGEVCHHKEVPFNCAIHSTYLEAPFTTCHASTTLEAPSLVPTGVQACPGSMQAATGRTILGFEGKNPAYTASAYAVNRVLIDGASFESPGRNTTSLECGTVVRVSRHNRDTPPRFVRIDGQIVTGGSPSSLSMSDKLADELCGAGSCIPGAALLECDFKFDQTDFDASKMIGSIYDILDDAPPEGSTSCGGTKWEGLPSDGGLGQVIEDPVYLAAVDINRQAEEGTCQTRFILKGDGPHLRSLHAQIEANTALDGTIGPMDSTLTISRRHCMELCELPCPADEVPCQITFATTSETPAPVTTTPENSEKVSLSAWILSDCMRREMGCRFHDVGEACGGRERPCPAKMINRVGRAYEHPCGAVWRVFNGRLDRDMYIYIAEMTHEVDDMIPSGFKISYVGWEALCPFTCEDYPLQCVESCSNDAPQMPTTSRCACHSKDLTTCDANCEECVTNLPGSLDGTFDAWAYFERLDYEGPINSNSWRTGVCAIAAAGVIF